FLRAYGLTAHPNILGGMLALGLIAAVGLWLSESPRAAQSARRVWLAPIALLTAGLAVSFSRAAWLGAASGLGALAVCVCLEGGETGWRERLGRWPSRLARLTPALGLIVLIGGFSVVSQPRLFWMRATGTGSSFEAESTRYRVTGWQISWQVIRQRWLWGVGTDQYLKGVSEALGAPAERWMLVHI
ncbi:MAG: O-antigen ligase family protein, partial [Anaerolineales bacterium]